MQKPSDHFDGQRYFNPGVSSPSIWDVVKWRWQRSVKPWSYVKIEQKKIPQLRTLTGECSITFITHSTFLIQLEGKNILTDPIWSQTAGPYSWLGPKRMSLPGVKLEDLPSIDYVLLSHNHYDHMDIPTLKLLDATHQPTFFVPKGNLIYLKNKGIEKNVVELDWWEHIKIGNTHQVHFVPAQHFSARTLFDHNRTLWGGFVLKSAQHLIYFAGDTGFNSHFSEIKRRLGQPTLSLLPIGAFKPRWFMQTAHVSPEESVQAHLILDSKQSIGMHFGTFQLADEEIQSPIRELHASLKRHHLPLKCFIVLEPGESKKMNQNFLNH